MNKTLVLFLLIFSIFNAKVNAQVNIEQYRSFTVTGNLEEVFDSRLNINTSLRRSSSSLYTIGFEYFKPFEFNRYSNGFFITKGKYGESKGEEFTNSNFIHLRIITKERYMSVKPEIFMQYENNKFASTIERFLYGFGLRYTIYGEVINGTSIINESYREEDSEPQYSKWRLSQYLKLKFNFNEFNKLNVTLYVQPRISDLTDIRYFSEFIFLNGLNEKVSYKSTLKSIFYNKSNVFNKVELYFNTGFEFKL